MEKDPELAKKVIRITGLKQAAIRFIVVDGSMASGEERKFSDWDLLVITKTKGDPPKGKKEFSGVFKSRLVTIGVMGSKAYEKEFYGYSSLEFPWYRKSVTKSGLIYGDVKEFNRLKKRGIARVKWTRTTVRDIIEHHYILALLEYYHKLLNTKDDKDSIPFYYFAGQFAYHFMWFLAGINRLDIESERTMHRQIIGAKTKPPGFKDDYLTLSSFDNKKLSKKEVLRAARKLMIWSRRYIIDDFGTKGFSTGFKEVLDEMMV